MIAKKLYAVYVVLNRTKPEKPYAVYQTRKEAVKTKKEAESFGYRVRIEKISKV